MTLGEDLPRPSSGVHDDPVTEAAKKGLNPTLRDVKKSVKVSKPRSLRDFKTYSFRIFSKRLFMQWVRWTFCPVLPESIYLPLTEMNLT